MPNRTEYIDCLDCNRVKARINYWESTYSGHLETDYEQKVNRAKLCDDCEKRLKKELKKQSQELCHICWNDTTRDEYPQGKFTKQINQECLNCKTKKEANEEEFKQRKYEDEKLEVLWRRITEREEVLSEELFSDLSEDKKQTLRDGNNWRKQLKTFESEIREEEEKTGKRCYASAHFCEKVKENCNKCSKTKFLFSTGKVIESYDIHGEYERELFYCADCYCKEFKKEVDYNKLKKRIKGSEKVTKEEIDRALLGAKRTKELHDLSEKYQHNTTNLSKDFFGSDKGRNNFIITILVIVIFGSLITWLVYHYSHKKKIKVH